MATARLSHELISREAQTLLRAVESCDRDQVRALLASGADPNAATAYGQTALMAAASQGDTEVVRMLLDAGAHINARKEDGFTPLICAVFFGHTDVVRLLLRSGADLNATDALGSTAQRWASSRGLPEIVQLLNEAKSHPPKKPRRVSTQDESKSFVTSDRFKMSRSIPTEVKKRWLTTLLALDDSVLQAGDQEDIKRSVNPQVLEPASLVRPTEDEKDEVTLISAPTHPTALIDLSPPTKNPVFSTNSPATEEQIFIDPIHSVGGTEFVESARPRMVELRSRKPFFFKNVALIAMLVGAAFTSFLYLGGLHQKPPVAAPQVSAPVVEQSAPPVSSSTETALPATEEAEKTKTLSDATTNAQVVSANQAVYSTTPTMPKRETKSNVAPATSSFIIGTPHDKRQSINRHTEDTTSMVEAAPQVEQVPPPVAQRVVEKRSEPATTSNSAPRNVAAPARRASSVETSPISPLITPNAPETSNKKVIRWP